MVVQNGKYGYIDHLGKIIIRPQFIWATDFWRGLGTVYVCGRYVSIDPSGRFLPLRITVEGHLEPRKSGEKFGFVDPSGQFKIKPTFDEVLPFSEGFAAIRIGDKWGFIDANGREVIPPQFEAAFYFKEGIATAELDPKSGFVLIDTSGKVVGSGFQPVDLIADGRIPASSRDQKSGFLDLRGKVAIPFIYDEVRSFSGGLAAVEQKHKWGYVDRNGHLAISLRFDEAGPFANGLAPAKVGSTSGFIDRSGRFSFYFAFQYAPGFLAGDEESNLFIAPADVSAFYTVDEKFGYVNTSGKVIWGPIAGSPDHAPLFGWSQEDKARSCEGFPESVRTMIAGFPEQ